VGTTAAFSGRRAGVLASTALLETENPLRRRRRDKRHAHQIG
jgi:hypothetical protein